MAGTFHCCSPHTPENYSNMNPDNGTLKDCFPLQTSGLQGPNISFQRGFNC